MDEVLSEQLDHEASTPEDALAALVVVKEIAFEFQRQNRRLRQLVAGLVASLLVVLGGAAWYGAHALDVLSKQSDQSDKIEAVAEDTNMVAKNVESLLENFQLATGDEAQARQQQRLATLVTELVKQVDCNNREALQEVVNQLTTQAGLRSINVLCEEA